MRLSESEHGGGRWRARGGSGWTRSWLHFQGLEDPRSEINRKHPLASVVVIALMAVLAGASGPTAIAQWAALKEEFLASVLPLPHGVPRKDVFRRVLMALKPGRLPGLLRRLAAVAARRGGRGDRRGAARRWRSTARRCGGATTARTAWAPCTR